MRRQARPRHYLDWAENWDAGEGLWAEAGPGHTPATAPLAVVHPGPAAAMRLLVAAQLRALNRLDVAAVLAGLQRTLILEKGKNFGRFRWYAEDSLPADDHAVFFNGMPLLCLWALYREQLDNTAQAMLAGLLQALACYAFRRASARGYYYPNEYLGYWLCAWVATEFFGPHERRAPLIAWIAEAADYWHPHGWGWGEHLSDTYGSICLEELSLILLLSHALPRNYGPHCRRGWQSLCILMIFSLAGRVCQPFGSVLILHPAGNPFSSPCAVCAIRCIIPRGL